MALQTFSIELPQELIEQLEQAGLAKDTNFFRHVLAAGLAQRQAETTYTLEEMEAAIDEGYGLLADSGITMDDVLAMKREEWELEERKLNRL